MPETDLRLGRLVVPVGEAAVMAIVNRTPDSFFDQGATFGDDAAMDAVAQAVAEGAALVDVGGVRAGPGEAVDALEERRRVVPFVARVRAAYPDLVISVDTWRSSVADAACGEGADLVNDAWSGHDPALAEVAARHGAGLVCSHTGGHPPRTDPHRVAYDDVVADVVDTTTALARRAVAAGVRPDAVLVDAAPDFGKNSRHSLAVVAATRRLADTGWPVLAAVSNKKFVAESLGLDGPKSDRHVGTLATTAVMAWEGARVVRAHDVAATRAVLDMVRALRTGEPLLSRRALA